MGAGTIVIAGGGLKDAVDKMIQSSQNNNWTNAQNNNAASLMNSYTQALKDFANNPQPT